VDNKNSAKKKVLFLFFVPEQKKNPPGSVP